jgi:hypothetical protein
LTHGSRKQTATRIVVYREARRTDNDNLFSGEGETRAGAVYGVMENGRVLVRRAK